MRNPVTVEMFDELIASLQSLRAQVVAGEWPPRKERGERAVTAGAKAEVKAPPTVRTPN